MVPGRKISTPPPRTLPESFFSRANTLATSRRCFSPRNKTPPCFRQPLNKAINEHGGGCIGNRHHNINRRWETKNKIEGDLNITTPGPSTNPHKSSRFLPDNNRQKDPRHEGWHQYGSPSPACLLFACLPACLPAPTRSKKTPALPLPPPSRCPGKSREGRQEGTQKASKDRASQNRTHEEEKTPKRPRQNRLVHISRQKLL